MAILAKSNLLMGDFRAFYCGGSVVLHGGNPYEAAPLIACESTPQPFGFHRAPHGLAEPVPFPGYAFALFIPFALLPFVPAALAWIVVQLAALGGAAGLLARMSGRPLAGVLAVFSLGYSAAVWTYGELASFALLCIVAAAFALRRGFTPLAVVALCGAAVLPHVVAPAFIALFLWERRARLPLVLGAAVLIALDLAIGGPSRAVSYFTSVLPAHAQSEIGYVTQYGLTWLLHAAGLPNRVALLCGNLSYVLMAALGIALGGALARRFAEPAFLVATPAGFAVIGGPFMHYSEITLALQLLVLLAARLRGGALTLAGLALLLVALPWQWVIQAPLIVAFVLAAYAIAVLFLQLGSAIALRTALGAAAYCAVIVIVAAKFGAQIATVAPAHLDPRLAQASWAEYIRTNSSSGGLVWIVAKLPTWIGLVLSALSCAYAVAKKDFVARVAVEQAPVGP